MKKIMNIPSNFVSDSLNGILIAHSDMLKAANGNNRAVVRADAPIEGKVAIVTGGGYGHLPLFLGYVGEGLCDGCAVGNVFTSPSCESILETSRAVHSGEGVLFLFGNYMGDQMNFEMAADFLADEGIETAIIRASDDIASSPRETWQERRGIAGILFAYKVAGALSMRGFDLKTIEKKTRAACENIVTYGVSFTSCQLPESDTPIFEISDTDMELGMGIHGEKGIKRCNLMSAAELSEYIVSRLIEDIQIKCGNRVAVLINGLGATSQEEQYILYGEVHKKLTSMDIKVVKSYIGEYVTSMEMAGVSVTLFKLNDEFESLLMDNMHTPFIKA